MPSLQSCASCVVFNVLVRYFVCLCVWYSVCFLCGSLSVWRDTDCEFLLRDRFIDRL